MFDDFNRNKSRRKSMPKKKAQPKAPIYTIHITLDGSDPEIWRRFTVPGNITMSALHEVIQVVMGWENCHMYEFLVDGNSLGAANDWVEPDPEFGDASGVCLMDLIQRKGQNFIYIYDMGDDWMHTCKVEAIGVEEGTKPGILCLGGENACPPEDSGGTYGYYNMLEAVKNPKHKEHAHFLEWLGEGFDPAKFDPEAANKMLKTFKLG
jgi:hypothetical protein